MGFQIPKALYKNKIAEALDNIRKEYGTLARTGYVYGILAIDQDAKIIAVDSRFDKKLNYWDLSSIGAALYGVARQGQDFFEAEKLERAAIIYDTLQIFVTSIGKVQLKKKGKREILIILLADKAVNIGVIVLQMSKYIETIKKEILASNEITDTLKMNEGKFKNYLMKLKKSIFTDNARTEI